MTRVNRNRAGTTLLSRALCLLVIGAWAAKGIGALAGILWPWGTIR